MTYTQPAILDDWTAEAPEPKKPKRKARTRAKEPQFTPNKYQFGLFDWIEHGQGNALVSARAGTGKTSTLKKASWRIPRGNKVLFLAFNKHIQEELKAALLTRISVSTIHGRGLYILRSKRAGAAIDVDDKKYWDLSGKLGRQLKEQGAITSPMVLSDLFNMARVTLTPINAHYIEAMVAKHGIEGVKAGREQAICCALYQLMAFGEAAYQESGVIDYADMIWLPSRLDLSAAKADWVFVDEAQDLSSAQLDVVKRCGHAGTRFVFVGDRAQAIFGFAGANSDSMDRIKAQMNAAELPLSICYRCPSAVLDLAREIVPDIEDAPDAPMGISKAISETEAEDMIEPGDMALARKTKDAISFCLNLIAVGKPAYVKGADIAKEICRAMDAITRVDGYSFDKRSFYVGEWEKQQVERATAQGPNSAPRVIKEARDTAEMLEFCFEYLQGTSMAAVKAEVSRLFSEDGEGVQICTIHRAKGLEAKRVFILAPGSMPMRYEGQTADAFRQEINLMYVAITRAQAELYTVGGSLHLDGLSFEPDLKAAVQELRDSDEEWVASEALPLTYVPLRDIPEAIEAFTADIKAAETFEEMELILTGVDTPDRKDIWDALPKEEQSRVLNLKGSETIDLVKVWDDALESLTLRSSYILLRNYCSLVSVNKSLVRVSTPHYWESALVRQREEIEGAFSKALSRLVTVFFEVEAA